MVSHVATAVRELLPPVCAIAVESVTPDVSCLTAREIVAVYESVPKRKFEFAAGRRAAKRALAELGLRGAEIPMGPNRAPQWPDGTVGSISHAGQIAIAAVAFKRDIQAIGIDLEISGSVGATLSPLILGASEQQWLTQFAASEQAEWATAIFCAKEAFYKFQYAASGSWLDFLDVVISFDNLPKFTVKVLTPTNPAVQGEYQGRFCILRWFTLAAIHAIAD